MFWTLYLLSSLFFSALIVNKLKKNVVFLFLLLTIVLVTPVQLEIDSEYLTPSLFSFFYQVLLEGNISFRLIRPLFLTVTAYIILFFVSIFIKKIFFQFRK